jgi:hypothetical protein
MIRRIAVVAALLALGCGSDTSSGDGGGGSGGGGGGAADLSMPADLANAFSCGNSVCMGGQKCCVTGMTPSCAGSCGDGGFEAQCNGPSNCGGNPCCITIGQGFTVQGVTCTMAPSACPPMVNAQTQAGMDRACHVDADCTAGLPAMPAPQLPDCCTNTMTLQHVCFNKSYLQFISGWTCP